MNKKLLIIIPVVIVIVGIFVLLGIKRSSSVIKLVNNRLPAHSLLNQARQFEAKGELLEAKSIYQKLVNDFTESPEVANWQKKAEDLNIQLLFSSAITPKSIVYQIKPGDTLNKIAREHKTTPELIMKKQ